MNTARGSADRDVAVIGSGPAAMALVAGCAALSLDVVRIGPHDPWPAIYGAWVDDVHDHACHFAATSAIDVVTDVVTDAVTDAVTDTSVGVRRRRLDRAYGVFDNDGFRRSLQRATGGSAHVEARVESVRHHAWGAQVHTDSGGIVRARIVVDASGAGTGFVQGPRSSSQVPLQRAYGVVLDHRPAAVGGDAGVLMDWRPPGGAVCATTATFLYVVPLAAGRWLVEETSLAAAPAMSFDALRARLATRLGHDHTSAADHVERVSIPMAPGVPSRAQSTIGFGAAAGYVHPATGYSIAASLRAAPRVAEAIGRSLGIDDPRARSSAVWDAVWPAEQRRARALHDYGSAALLRLRPHEVAEFFDAFFALPVEQWAAYLRIDTTPTAVRTVMAGVFTKVSWPLRWRLATGNPAAMVRSIC